MRTIIYIDGFNFYYRAVKNTPYKWLDFKSLFGKLLSKEHVIIEIKYFTALVSGKGNPNINKLIYAHLNHSFRS